MLTILGPRQFMLGNVLANLVEPNMNTWQLKIRTYLIQLTTLGLFKSYDEKLLPVFEAKYIYNYNHRYSLDV